MLYIQESSSSLPSGLDSVHAASGELSWLETPRTSSLASSISEDASDPPAKKVKVKEAPLWRSFFTARSRSIGDRYVASPYLMTLPPNLLNAEDSWTPASDGPNPARSGSSTPEKLAGSTRTSFLKGRWTSSRPGRGRRNSNASSHEQLGEPSSRSSSRSAKGRKDAAQGLSKRPEVSPPYNFQHLSHKSPGAVLDSEADRKAPGEMSASTRTSMISSRDPCSGQCDEMVSLHSLDQVDPAHSLQAPARAPPPPPLPLESPSASVGDMSPTTAMSPPGSAGSLRSSTSSDHVRTSPRRASRASMLVVPPPRTSSRMALVRQDGFVDSLVSSLSTLSTQDASSPSLEHDAFILTEEPTQTSYNGSDAASWPLTAPPMPHAVTTPDDTAWPLQMPAHASGSRTTLADVPEEEEGAVSPRSYSSDSVRRTSAVLVRQDRSTSGTQTAFVTPAGRASLVSLRPLSQAARTSRPGSRSADVDAQPRQSRVTFSPSLVQSRRASLVEMAGVDDSWEADIDYCYEHAAEASCEYEWIPNPDPTEPAATDEVNSTGPNFVLAEAWVAPPTPDQLVFAEEPEETDRSNADGAQSQDRSDSSPQRPSLLVSTQFGPPSLDCSPAITTANESEIMTPAQPTDPAHSSPRFRSTFLRNPFKESGVFVIDHSLCLPAGEEEHMSEAMHGRAPGDGVRVVRHYSVTEPTEEAPESEVESCPSRNSLQKWASQESVEVPEIASRATQRRLEGSFSKVPELVHSRRGSEEPEQSQPSSTKTDGVVVDTRNAVNEKARPSHSLPSQKASSYGNLQHAVTREPSLHPARERSHSVGTAKAAHAPPPTTRRRAETKSMHRNQSTSSFRSLRGPSTRFSYVLFPTTTTTS